MPSLIKSLALLADETRLRLLLLLRAEELSVAEIQEVLGMGQSRISNHLAQLRQAGFLEDRRAGKNIYYVMAKTAGGPELAPILAAAESEIADAARDRTALQVLLNKRNDRAREYFNQLAGKFGRAYCPGRTWDGVAHLLFTLIPELTIADLGAGEGTLAQLLAKRAKKVIAVDSSEKMVEFGSNLAKKHGFANLEYRLGDIEDPPILAATVDLALFSQALHHAARPERAIAAAHRILKPGGKLAILDLLQHQFEEARELYADHWLGFSEADLHRFLEGAGFREIDVRAVAREPQPPHFQVLLATALK
ncbi:MAG TPA: metalloregulator ArsR/SmtB family transcription factor [Chthoniobacteraceae bacterium]|jgi:ubiquinone/menaquinone biosynthesis C-methylase UbiE/biotin operon repressor|nr:transcriptional regulator [Chthoniobacter sp.]HEV7867762.1 metalloregulator ArsR/SmtB family transcription factor [Chthoniobacteraceae bacterium]